MKTKRVLPPHKARVENHDGRYFARQPSGQLWCLPETAHVAVGDTILITIHSYQDQFCGFVRLAPELAD